MRHLAGFTGVLQADAYAGYDSLFADGQIVEAACWAHARRKYFEIHERQNAMPGTLAHQALERISALYAIEKDIRENQPMSAVGNDKAALGHYWMNCIAGSMTL